MNATKSMSKCYLDSNVFVYLKDNNSPYQKLAIKLVQSLNPEEFELYISSLTIDEFLHSSLFILKQTIKKPETAYLLLEKALSSIIDLPHLQLINPSTDKIRNKEVLKLLREFNLHPRDAYHLLIMRENGIREFATFDNDFKKVFKKSILRLLR